MQEGKLLHGMNDWPVHAAISSALMIEGGMQSADEALAGEDVRTLRTLAALTGGMWEIGPE